MKKLVILGTALLALNAVASEIQLKAGYDLSRKYKNGNGDIEDFKFKKGPTLGLEYIFDNQGEFEWGLGAEYKFSSNSGSLKDKDNNKIVRVAPVYALGKFNLITTAAGNDALYVLGRAGYGFASEHKYFGEDISGGLYAAAGLGTEFGPVSLEALVERQNIKYTYSSGVKDKDKIDTFGLRLGYRLGNLVNDRQPKIVERVVRETVTVTPPAPVKQPIVTGKTVALPFSCAADERKCIIRGFKVDGRVPSETEAQDLRTIAGIINQFADGGSIDFIGHTDSTGSDAYNQKLSVARAQNVARLLREYGLKNSVSYGAITGRGESQPADTNATVEGRYNNRRVELFFNNVDFSNVTFTN
ncbi:MAG: OmpA family protein [Leptotrichiaceae bacterium]|nr:OmpA family protein [Leptotrichiaceae bacterium]MBP6280515.1 OmpA family protein [Leptotrichiaceae bacterium]MBP7100076.1 OmpA family protein [Leptotrichiaceae bacterium]MBP7725225.1 OmpA family protein [Leptotrichiaceae bacterium]MBP9629870.1 OmpA family protein [Leptotrichiaceae bacterium]